MLSRILVDKKMSKMNLFFGLLAFFTWSTTVLATGQLLSLQASGEQDVYRLELQLNQLVDTNKIGFQFQGKNLILNVPEFEIKKPLSNVESKVNYISAVKIANSKQKSFNIEFEFSEINSVQMKENVSIEGLGKTLIIEILPPLWSKGNSVSSQSNHVNSGADLNSPSEALPKQNLPQKNFEALSVGVNANSENSNLEEATTTSNDKLPKAKSEKTPTDESKVLLFDKKSGAAKESSEVGKIIFTVLSILALGGYLIWHLKKKSKMINGPESLMKIKMITQFHLGPKKSLAVVRVAGESLLLGITDNDIRLIKTLALLDEDLPEILPDSFNETLAQQNTADSKIKPHVEHNKNINEEEFSFGPAVKMNIKQKIPMLRKII